MDFLKYKLALVRKNRTKRFGYSDPLADLTKPELFGLLPHELDFYFGCPNKERRENISFIASNSSNKNTLLVDIKWRPGKKDSTDYVTQINRVTLVVNDKIYEHEQVETFVPQLSKIRKNQITYYGSTSSSLKLFIPNPYLRMRLVFRGNMKAVGSNELTFVKLNLVINATSAIYDFRDKFNPNCFKQSYEEMKVSRGYYEALTDLLCHDRHEHLVRMAGDCFIGDDSQFREIVFFWGFYGRHFLDEKSELVESKRILAHMSNGQAFHVARNCINEDKIDCGYACVKTFSNMTPIEKPFVIKDEEFSETSESFNLEVSCYNTSFKIEAKRREKFSKLYDANLDGKSGWAYISKNDSRESQEDIEAVKRSERKFEEERMERVALSLPLPSNEKPNIVCIDDSQCACIDLVGAKAASLAQLKLSSKNFIVPSAIVLTRFAYDLLLEKRSPIREAIERLETSISEGKLEKLKEECKAVEDLICATQLPDELSLELASKIGQKKLEEMKFAVRSSSWGEDEEDMSAAGQLNTLLNVKGLDSIEKAVMSCFGSKFTYANIEYKRQRGLAPNLPMAVVIQEMVDCEKAGVMFTCDPTNGDESSIVITANYGLGESVVSGQTEPDCVKVKVDQNCSLKVGDIKIGSKKVVIDGEGAQSNQYDRTKCCLNEEEIMRLAETGLVLKKYFQSNEDIEWGFKGDQLYLLQSRPVTGLDSFTEFELIHEADMPSRAEFNFLSRANIGEVMPFAVRPLTLTYCTYFWSVMGARMFSRFSNDEVAGINSAQEVLFVAYHSFFNLRSSTLFPLEQAETGAANKSTSIMSKAMQVGFFGHEIEDPSDILEASRGIVRGENPFAGPKFDSYTARIKKSPLLVASREKNVLRTLRASIRNLKLATGYESNKMLGLYNQMKNVTKDSYQCWENHIVIIMLAGVVNMQLSLALAKYIKEPTLVYTALAKFFATSPNVISAEIPERIEKITGLIKSMGDDEVKKFINMSAEECLEYIEKNETINKEYKTFIELFGHRCYNEFELAVKSWAQDQSIIVDLLKKSCASEKGESGHKKLNSVEEVFDSLGVEFEEKDKFMLKNVIVPKCQEMVATRECTKDILVEYNDILKEVTGMLAKELRRNFRIPDEDLFYYLFYEELEPLIREPQPSIVVQATRRRNMFKIFKEPWKFDEIIKGYDFIPNHLKPTKELDEKVSNAPRLYGTPASSGRVQGKVCLVQGYHELDKVRAGDILLTHSTDIAFSPVFPLISGIITEVGGLISHGAVVAREYGLPSVLGIPDITRILQDGEEILLDANNGLIIRLSKGESS